MQDGLIGSITSLYLLCCILHIVKIKDLANVIAAVLFSQPEAIVSSRGIKVNGTVSSHNCSHQRQCSGDQSASGENSGPLKITVSSSSSDMESHSGYITISESSTVSHVALR